MDSLKTKITSAKQMSKVDTVNFADGSSWLGSDTEYQRVIFIPEKARVCGFGVVVSDVVTTATGTNKFEIGHIAGTLQSDAALVNVAAAADPNAYATTIDLEVAGITTHAGVNSAGTAAVTSGVELMGMPPTVTLSTSYTYAPSATAAWSASGEKVVPVVGLLTLGGAQTGGCFHWWVDYAFDANIVWTQAALA